MDTTAIRKQRTEIFVGLFVFFGLAIMGMLILQFGQISDRARGNYTLLVEFPDAGGLRSGSPVQLGGQKVGYVDGNPKMKDDFSGVNVKLAIYSDQRIPKNSTFAIGTSGLMGDTFVEAKIAEKFTGEFIQDGASIQGSTAADLGELQNDAGKVLKDIQLAVADIQVAVKSLNRVFTKIETGVLGDANVENLTVTFAELRTSSENVKKATEKLDPLMSDVKGTIAEAKTAMTKASETLDGIKETVSKADPALEKLEPTIAELKATLENANSAIDEIKNGDGVMAGLISDSGLRTDLESFVEKLDRYGILGYPKNKTEASSDNSSPSNSPSTKKTPSSITRRRR